MTRHHSGFASLGARPLVPSASAGLNAKGRSRHALSGVFRARGQWLPLLALVLLLAAPLAAFAQGSQQMNTAVYGVSTYSVTSDGAGNIFFPVPGGNIAEGPAGAVNDWGYLALASGSGVTYPFTNPVVAVVSDVSGDLFVAVQNPLVGGTSGPYFDVYEIVNTPVFFTGDTTAGSPFITNVSNPATASLFFPQYIYGPDIPPGDVGGPDGSGTISLEFPATITATGVEFEAPVYVMGPQVYGLTTPPPILDEPDYSTLNSMAYDNLNGFLYLNYVPGGEQPQVITCHQISIDFTGTTSLGSTQVAVSSISGLIAGQIAYGLGLPPGDTIASVGPGNIITLTSAATAAETATPLGVTGPLGLGCGSTNGFTSPLNGYFGNGLAVDGAGNVYTAYGTGSGTSYIAQLPLGPTAAGKNYSPSTTDFTVGTDVFPGNVGLVGLAADDAGQIFVDTGAEIWIYSPLFNGSTPNGTFIPVAGTGVNGNNGVDGTATLLQLDYSEGVALDPNGALWIADTGNGYINEITPAGFGQGEGTGTVGGSPAFGCLQCGPQSLGNGTGGVAGYGNQPAPTDIIQTNHISNITLLNPITHKLYIAYPNALVIFDTSSDTVQTSTVNSATEVDIILQQITQMVLDPTTNVIWAINSAGQVLEINGANDEVSSAEIVATGQYQAQAIAIDTKLNQVYVAYSVTSTNGITVSYYLAVVNGATGVFSNTLSLQGPAQAMVADSSRGTAYLIAQDPYSQCNGICAQYDYDLVVINGTTNNKGTPVEITSTNTLIEGSPYSSGVTQFSLAVDPHTGKVVFADAVDAYFSLYNPAVPSYEAVDHVSLGWIPNAVTIDTANSIAYLSDGQYNNVQAIGLAAVLANTSFGWSYNLFSGTQGGASCGAFSNAVAADPTVGQVFITTCTVNTTTETDTPVLNQLQYTGVTASGAVLTPIFTCGYGPTCSPLDTYNLPVNSTQSGGFNSYSYVLNVDTSDHALFVANGEGVPTGAGLPNTLPNILVFNGNYPPADRPQQALSGTTFNFSGTGLGLEATNALNFTNSGDAPMLDPVIAISGPNAADFSYFDGCTSGVPASGGFCTDSIIFTPSLLGSESATAVVIDDSPDVPQTLTLSGTGELPMGTGMTATNTLLQVSKLQVMPGAQLTLYAIISPAITSSLDQVLFLDNNTNPATVLGFGTYKGGSVWSLSTSFPTAGTYALTAYYAGDSTYMFSTSGTVNVVISSSTGPGPSQPLLSFTPGSFYQPETGTTSNYSDVAIDAAGDDFVLDSGVGSVTEYSVGGGAPISYVPADSYVDPGGYRMTHPTGLAAAPDGGTVYITDTPDGLIAEATSAGSLFLSELSLYGLGDCNGGTPSGFASVSSPEGISIGPVNPSQIKYNDIGYDLYVADSGNQRVLEINPQGGNTSECGFYPGGYVDAILAGTGSPGGPALIDPLNVVASTPNAYVSGSNVYIADAPPAINNPTQGPGTIYENGTALTNANIVFPYSLAVDAAGDAYYSDQALSEVWRIDTQGTFLLVAGNGLNSAPASPCTSAAKCQATQTSILTPYGLGVSGNGSIFIGDASGTGQIGEVDVTEGMVTFPSQPSSTTSSALTVTVTDTAAMPVGATNISIAPSPASADPTDFAISGGTCNTVSGFSLNPGQSCTILVTFTPPGATGPRTAQINLLTQSEIYGGTLQTIQLSGNGVAAGPAPQTITFPPPLRPVLYGSAAEPLSATASSGLAVQYTVLSGPGFISSSTVSFTGVGTVKIIASQAGNGTTYTAASSVEQDISVLPAILSVTALPATRCYEAVNPSFTPSITGYVGSDTPASVGLSGSPTFTVTGGYPDSNVGTQLTVTPSPGTLGITSPNYIFSMVPGTLNVTCKESQAILPASVPPPNLQIPIGTPFSLTVMATSGLPVVYTYEGGPGAIGTSPLGGYTLTPSGTGDTITVTASQPGNGNVNAATPVTLTFVGK